MMTQHTSASGARNSILASAGVARAPQTDLSIPVGPKTAARAPQTIKPSAADLRASAIERCTTILAALESKHGQWFDDFAMVDADLSSKNAMAKLWASAPDQFLGGMVAGKLTMRLEIASITGRHGRDTVDPQIVAAMGDTMGQLEQLSPEWFDDFSRADAFVGSDEEIFELMSTAPHQYLLGFLYGKLTTRTELRAITGR